MDLFKFFTQELSPAIRDVILRSIGDRSMPIVSQAWMNDGNGCIFVVAAAAVEGTTPASFRNSEHAEERIAMALGVRREAVREGAEAWDLMRRAERRAFRRRIRLYVGEIDLQAQREFSALTAQTAEETLVLVPVRVRK